VRVTRHRYAIEGWGVGEIWASDGLLLAHELPGPVREAASVGGDLTRAEPGPAPPDGGARPPEFTLAGDPSPGGDAVVPDLCRRVAGHLAGARTAYADVPLDLSWCTGFQRALLEALRAVPWGEVVSYGELAALAGRPRAARAAGSFCAGNRFALVVPCHRVVAADGIGGYGSSGVGLKRRLLLLEGVRL
jgi:methylated-DNA-[protein]-cysteine S-methyltransferase